MQEVAVVACVVAGSMLGGYKIIKRNSIKSAHSSIAILEHAVKHEQQNSRMTKRELCRVQEAIVIQKNYVSTGWWPFEPQVDWRNLEIDDTPQRKMLRY